MRGGVRMVVVGGWPCVTRDGWGRLAGTEVGH